MTLFFSFLTAILGVILGGFLGRAAYALPRGEYREILSPKCPFCGRVLPAIYSFPIVGSILFRVRCSHCGERQGVKVLFSELFFGAIALLLYLKYAFSYLFFVYLITAGVLLLLSLIDLDIKEVPHSLLFVILLLGVMSFVFSFFDFSLTETVWWEHLVGAFAISLPLFLLMMFTGGIGGGDVKLMFCLGLLLGYRLVLLSFLFGIVSAAIVAIALHFLGGKSGKYQLPLVPFLSLGAMIAILWGGKILSLIF